MNRIHRLPGSWSLAWLTIMGSAVALGQEIRDATTELGRLKASGAPTRIADLKREIGATGTNAARILDPVREKWWAIDLAVADSFQFGDERLSPRFLEAWESVADERRIVFAAVDQATRADVWMPRFLMQAETAGDVMEEQESPWLRVLARVLMYRSRVRLQAGDADAAAQTALNIIRLARLHPQTGLAGYLNSNVIQQIGLGELGNVLTQSGGLSLDVHQAIEAELAQHDSLDGFTESLIAERVIGLQMIRDQGVVGLTRIEPYLKAMRMAIGESGKTIGQQPALLDPQEHGSTGGMLDPGLQMVRGSANRGLAMVRCLRIVNCLQGKMIDNPDLEKIDLPGDTKTDPFIDMPLVLRATDQGVLIYSVGRNRLDDGGEIRNQGDIGFRIPLRD